jgi:type I restriction enzyme S subunit
MALRVPRLNSKYVFFFCLANYNKLHRLGAGSTVPGIDRKSMLSVTLPLAPREEQDIIVQKTKQKLSATTHLIGHISLGVSKAARLRQAILKAAFAGRLVRQNTNDEPASALLNRIVALKHTKNVAEPLRDIRHLKQTELRHYGK